jgi:hypothetical protein
MGLNERERESIKAIRSWGDAFDGWTDEQVADFYSEWSQETFAAHWICQGERMFYEYAITMPVDVKAKELGLTLVPLLKMCYNVQ